MPHNYTVELYDLYVGDWPGEIDFYLDHAQQAHAQGTAVLEVACGTGRIAIRLAEAGIAVTGLDHSPEYLAIARSKSADRPNIQWVQADMRAFDLETQFGLAIIPGHAFQNIHTADDQVAALSCIRRHLLPGGTLIVHHDHAEVDWLGDIQNNPYKDVAYGEKLVHPTTGQICRMKYTWAYERPTQTAYYLNAWEILDENDHVLERHENEPNPLHCIFRNEMELAAKCAGFEVTAVYGDFFRHGLSADKEEVVWVLKNP